MKRLSWFKTASALMLVLLLAAASASAEPWRFGVMSDTQWIGNEDGKNPYTVSVDIINQLNQQFINHGVKFVIQVGDLTDKGNKAPYTVTKVVGGVTSTYAGTATQALDTRAIFAQPLYNHGIGFFPLRGNHEDLQSTAVEFVRIFPQTSGGQQNTTPIDVFTISNPDAATQPFPTKTGSAFSLGSNFNSPSVSGLGGLSYSFDYFNTRFVLLDQFTRTDGSNNSGGVNNNIIDQLPWIDAALSGKPTNGHAFVFSHKNLIGEQHTDTLFGANPSTNPAAQNTFLSSLQAHGVRYAMSGHDHVNQRSLITSPDGNSKVTEIITGSDSSKFYIPLGNDLYLPTITVNNDLKYNTPAYGITNGPREMSIAQETYKVTYYVVTVDGPRVTVDYYSADNSGATLDSAAGEFLISTTPTLAFTKKETFGYSLNGKEFLVPQGESYAHVQDSFEVTAAQILDGVNGSTMKDGSYRPLTKAVNTGWTHRSQVRHPGWRDRDDDNLASNILSLWGMANLGNDKTDTYVLSMTYDTLRGHLLDLLRGEFGLAVRNAHGKWINAVDANFGGTKRFVLGPWKSSYKLGTYGVDPFTRTAWAVINHAGDFAVAEDLEPGSHHHQPWHDEEVE
jgi:hypothetical protein